MRALSFSLFGLALVLFFCGQAFYVFVFQPEHHGGFGSAFASGVLDWEGWWAFTKSTPGLILRGSALFALIAAVLLGRWSEPRGE